MTERELKKRIDVAAGRTPADLAVRNAKIVDVFNCRIIEGDVAVADGMIAGIGGPYHGKQEIDAEGKYLSPGLIDSHIHIESSYVTPEEMGRMAVPHGMTTIIADPHEIVNVAGIDGLDYMMKAAQQTALDIFFMLPSCVPATPFETSGAVLDAEDMIEPLKRDRILGLGEFMDFPGVVHASGGALKKLTAAHNSGKIIDGHSPGLIGMDLNAYAAAGICDDHECTTVQEMTERISLGMYVLLREGSACHDLRPLLKGLTPENSRRCLLCSDDRQPWTMIHEGHIDHHLQICAQEGVDPFTAIRMATLNAAECFRLYDRGALAPGRRADMVLFDDLKTYRVRRVWIAGEECASDGIYEREVHHVDYSPVRGSVHAADFSEKKLRLHLKTGHVRTIDLQPGGIMTRIGSADIALTEEGDFMYNPSVDLVKTAVVERHHNTGNVAVGLLRGYGIRRGAVAVSIAHDSHNLIAAGVSNSEMAAAVQAVIDQKGGIALVLDGVVAAGMALPVGGLMSDQTGERVEQQLEEIRTKAFEVLGINRELDPIMTLCFMSLAVVPEIKLTDRGLFDVTKFDFVPLELN